MVLVKMRLDRRTVGTLTGTEEGIDRMKTRLFYGHFHIPEPNSAPTKKKRKRRA
ncbi:hypothetical protein QJV44_gp29 [Serratia phage vB_SmaS_Tlacuache]|uniref:Uncharacterized protein n=1 Tax=Serratia phage vB_SmaS_Tlacuache TaxID=2894809 RepID=A0AAE8YVE9_9CAUD|nr:hypothetical protein QJV44_gp29 [Serratia phage vB_SmaS_Tlacuache]UGO51443.1 hypothetical protein TLACUACHE_29 [Serratia phage vB_SmaS_Tlacuache]